MRSSGRSLWLGGAHLAVLWAFGFAQPLFEILSDSPEFFVARGNTRGDVLALTLGLVLVPPAAMLLAEAVVARVSRPAAEWVHLGFVALLVAALALQALDSLFDAHGAVLIALAAVVGAAAAAAYAQTRFVPTVLTVLAPVPALFCVLFLFFSPVKDIVLPQEEAEPLAAEVRDPAPVVFVVFDEFPITSILDRHGEIDAFRFPNLARFARHSTWYRNATTVSDFTNRAVPGLLTGTDPGPDVLPSAEAQPESVFTLLGDSYRLEVLEDVTNLCPSGLCARRSADSFAERLGSLTSDLTVVSGHVVLPQPYRDSLPPIDTTFGDFAAGGLDAPDDAQAELAEALGSSFFTGRPARYERFLDSLTGARKALYFLHVQLPHLPWQYLPSGKGYPVGDPALQSFAGSHGRWTEQEWLVQHAWQRHLLQAGYVDLLVGRLIERLRDEGIWDRAVVVLAADHGIAFRPGVYRREVTQENVGDLAGVPLLIKVPGQRRGRVDERPARTVDVLPTIADMLGVELPFETDGTSLEAGASNAVGRSEVSVANRYGSEETLAFRDFLRIRDRIVARRVRLFGSGGWRDVYGFGPNSELIGRPAPAGSEPVAGEFSLADPELYADVDPESLAVPALVRGEISGLGADEPLAVAVNGTVAAVGRSYEIEGTTYVSIVIAPWTLRAGANDVRLFRVAEEERPPALEPLEPAGVG